MVRCCCKLGPGISGGCWCVPRCWHLMLEASCLGWPHAEAAISLLGCGCCRCWILLLPNPIAMWRSQQCTPYEIGSEDVLCCAVVDCLQVLLQAEGHQQVGGVRGAAGISTPHAREGTWPTPGAAEAAARQLLTRAHNVSRTTCVQPGHRPCTWARDGSFPEWLG